jgi:hypothetical protein
LWCIAAPANNDDNDRQQTLSQLHGAVIIAVIAMGMVQASIDQIINVAPVGNRLMPTARAMSMRLLVSGGAMLWVAPIGIGRADLDHVFSYMAVFNVLQMSLVQIVHVPFMLNRDMATVRAVHVGLIGGGHGFSFLIGVFSATHDRQRFRQD